MAPKQAPVLVSTDAELAATVDDIAHTLALTEGEDTWDKIAAALARLEAATKAGAYKRPPFVALVLDRRISSPVATSVRSNRSGLSGVATSFLASLAPRLGDRFEPLVPAYVPPLIDILSRTNKVFRARATKTLSLVMAYCPLPAPLLRLLAPEQATSKDAHVRAAVVQLTITLLQSCPDRVVHRLHRGHVPGLVEQILSSAVADSSSDVRAYAKILFGLYEQRYTPRVESYVAIYPSLPLLPLSQCIVPLLSRFFCVRHVCCRSKAGCRIDLPQCVLTLLRHLLSLPLPDTPTPSLPPDGNGSGCPRKEPTVPVPP